MSSLEARERLIAKSPMEKCKQRTDERLHRDAPSRFSLWAARNPGYVTALYRVFHLGALAAPLVASMAINVSQVMSTAPDFSVSAKNTGVTTDQQPPDDGLGYRLLIVEKKEAKAAEKTVGKDQKVTEAKPLLKRQQK